MFWTYANSPAYCGSDWVRHPGFPTYVIIQAPTWEKANEKLTSLAGADRVGLGRQMRNFVLYNINCADEATDVPTANDESVATGNYVRDSFVVYYEDGTVIRGGHSS